MENHPNPTTVDLRTLLTERYKVTLTRSPVANPLFRLRRSNDFWGMTGMGKDGRLVAFASAKAHLPEVFLCHFYFTQSVAGGW